jgi:hypothetical protein
LSKPKSKGRIIAPQVDITYTDRDRGLRLHNEVLADLMEQAGATPADVEAAQKSAMRLMGKRRGRPKGSGLTVTRIKAARDRLRAAGRRDSEENTAEALDVDVRSVKRAWGTTPW